MEKGRTTERSPYERREGIYLTSGTAARFVFFAVTAAAFAATYLMFARNADIADNYAQVTRTVALVLFRRHELCAFTVAEVLLSSAATGVLIYLTVMIVRICQNGHLVARLLRAVSNLWWPRR